MENIEYISKEEADRLRKLLKESQRSSREEEQFQKNRSPLENFINDLIKLSETSVSEDPENLKQELNFILQQIEKCEPITSPEQGKPIQDLSVDCDDDEIPFQDSEKFQKLFCSIFDSYTTPNLNVQKILSLIEEEKNNSVYDPIKEGRLRIPTLDPASKIEEELKNNPCLNQAFILNEKIRKKDVEIEKTKDEIENFEEEYNENLFQKNLLQGKMDYAESQYLQNIEFSERIDFLKEVYDDAIELLNQLQELFDFNETISKRIIDETRKIFNINILENTFSRNEIDYLEKRNTFFNLINQEFQRIFTHQVNSFYNQGLKEGKRDQLLFGNNRFFFLEMKSQFDSFINNVWNSTEEKWNELNNYLEKIKSEKQELEQKLENLNCDLPDLNYTPEKNLDEIQDTNIELNPENSTTNPPLFLSKIGIPTPFDLEYWKRWCNLATIVNLTNPRNYWPIGLLIPTPARIIRIPMPIIWKPLIVIPALPFIVVFIIGQCGVVPSPFVFILDSTSLSSIFAFSLRGPQIIRDTGNTQSKTTDTPKISTIFGERELNPTLARTLPLIRDDIPDFSRLNLQNIPFITQMLDEWNKSGKRGGGFFENP
jgi:hypothetical protein